MSARVVIMTEEESMTAFLRQVLPVAFPERVQNVDWLIIQHRGKSELEASIARKIRAWREPHVRFLIARDNDGADCKALKARLVLLLPDPPLPPCRVRIVCQQLESWLLGDPDALAAAYPQAGRHPSFRSWTRLDPDGLPNAAELVHHLTRTRAKVTRADAVARHMDPARNRSRSFRVFMEGLEALLA